MVEVLCESAHSPQNGLGDSMCATAYLQLGEADQTNANANVAQTKYVSTQTKYVSNTSTPYEKLIFNIPACLPNRCGNLLHDIRRRRSSEGNCIQKSPHPEAPNEDLIL
uniref:Uncharacterized protein n=1 Tax=Steinernema glaseri TaxID=37863 RepID=A0A1I7Z9Q5_9BILA